MLDHLDDVASDLSAFHRVDDPMRLSSSRYFLLAERLPAYQGAVASALAAKAAPALPVAPGSGGGPEVIDDVSTVARMTSASGFPGIEYVGG